MKVIFEHKGGRRQPMQRRFAEILKKMGRGTYMTRDMVAAPPPDPDDLSALRAEYQKVVGKRPFHGWDVEEIRARMAAVEGDE